MTVWKTHCLWSCLTRCIVYLFYQQNECSQEKLWQGNCLIGIWRWGMSISLLHKSHLTGENGTSVASISTTLFLLDEIYEPVSWSNSTSAIKLSMLASSSWRPLPSLKQFLDLDQQTIEKWPLMLHNLQVWFHAGHAC